MTNLASGVDPAPDDTPDWAVANPAPRRIERRGAYVQLALGLLFVLASLVLIVVEAWQILTGPTVAFEETVAERLGWPLIPGIFGAGLLIERWLDQRSMDVR